MSSKAVHDFLMQTKLPWDVAKIIKAYVGPNISLPDDGSGVADCSDLAEADVHELIKFRSRHKKRAFTI